MTENKQYYKTIALAVMLSIALWNVKASAQSPEACSQLTEPEKSQLAQYVQKKYKIPASARVEIVADSLLDKSCYHKLQFRSGDATHPFSLALYSSPDAKLLLPELFDVSIDPAAEELKKNREIMGSLMHGDFPSLGPPNAPVTIVEFADFQCPFCQHAASILKSFLASPDGKNVRVVFRHFPLAFHPWAQFAAEATACVNFQNSDRFWELHDWIFEHQKSLTAANSQAKLTEAIGAMAGIDMNVFHKCMEESQAAGLVKKDASIGSANEVRGTPTFFINGRRMAGLRSLEDLRAIISEAQQDQPGPAQAAQK
jgi:predicted DsbA family dithiol-disulfide isomerase